MADALFGRAFEWALERGLDTIIGPKGFGPIDGFGILIDGYDLRPMMTMMNYNPPYYVRLIESLGFTKEVDFISCYADNQDFRIEERVYKIVDRIKERRSFPVQTFCSQGYPRINHRQCPTRNMIPNEKTIPT